MPAAPLAHFARARLPASATHTAPRWRRWAGGGGPQQPVNAGMGVGRPTPHRCAWRCARLCARAVCALCSCGLSSVCACSGPCLLHVPVLCVLGLCAFVLVVWCACIAFVYIVRPSPVNVVDITAVRGVLVRFVVGVCVLGPLPAARARAVCARAVRAATARCDLCW